MAVTAMSYQRQTTRSAILIGISVWLGAHGLSQLDGTGISSYAACSLAMTGLIVMLPLLAWPWARRRLLMKEDELGSAVKPRWTRHETLVTAQIVLLSALLICLIIWMPA